MYPIKERMIEQIAGSSPHRSLCVP